MKIVKDKKISVRIHSDIYDELIEKATSRRMSVSEYVRMIVEKDLENKK